MEPSTVFQLILLLILLVSSAFFSGSETAFFSLNRWRVMRMIRKGSLGARRVERLRSRPHRLLITILLGNNLANIAATAMMESSLEARFGHKALPISIAVMTVVVLLVGEILPKSVAAHRPEGFAGLAAAPIQLFARVTLPFRTAIRLASQGILHLLGISDPVNRQGVTEEQFRAALQEVRRAGLVEEREGRILERVFALKTTPVHEIMVPRTRIVSVPAESSPAEALRLLEQTGRSRIPVYREDPEEIFGLLYAKDMLAGALGSELPATVGELIREPMFVPASMRVRDLLQELQSRRLQTALVVDEHGGVAGLVTVEDALELVVGDIFDEQERPVAFLQDRIDGSVDVLGRTPVERFQERFGPILPEGESQTVAGRLMEQLGRLPEEGQVLELEERRITIIRVVGPRVVRLRVEAAG